MPFETAIRAQARLSSGMHSALWAKLFVQSPNAQLICDRSGILHEVNPAAVERFGSIAGGSLMDVLVLTNPVIHRMKVLLQAAPRKEEVLEEVELRSEVTHPGIVDITLSPLESEYWLIVIQDADQRLRRETQTQQLIAAIDSTPDVVILTDKDFLITFVNPAFETLTGIAFKEALGQPVNCFHAPKQRDLIEEYKNGVRRGADWFGEVLMQRKEGSRYPVDMTLSPVYDCHGRFIGTVAFQRDTSSRKKLHEALLMERNFAQSIINSLEACLYTLDGQFRITHSNNGWKRIRGEHGWLKFDQPPQEGSCLLDYVVDETRRSQLFDAFQQVLSEGRPQDLQSVDVSGRHWVMNIYPWHHEGKIRGLIYRVTDNSAFVSVQVQLFQAQRLCTLGALVAGVAHDFNNLILAMRGNLGLASMEKSLPGEVRARLQQVDEAAVRATDLTRQLLSFSRPTPEKATVLDFNQVVIEAVELVKKVFRGRVKVRIESAPAPLKVKMDATRAAQAMMNLCINASDAMTGGGTLTITNSLVELTPTQRSKVRHNSLIRFMRCSVADTGTGIPSELLPKIFNPFFTTKGEGKGTGLGLSILNSVVTKAGGFIEVETALNKGTTFNVYLPLDEGAITKVDTEMQRQICKGTGRLLVVDDLDIVLEFAASFLRQAGYQVFTANSADSALKMLSQQHLPIDLLFTDYTMPGKTGWQLVQEVLVRWPLTRCALASGYIDQVERAEIEKHPSVRILNKPYGIAEATVAIAEILGLPTSTGDALHGTNL